MAEDGDSSKSSGLRHDRSSDNGGTTVNASNKTPDLGGSSRIKRDSGAQKKPAETASTAEKPASNPQSAAGQQAAKENLPISTDTLATGLPVQRQCRGTYCGQLRRTAEGKSQPLFRPESGPHRDLSTERNVITNIAFDQLHIWESPIKLRDSDAPWAVPFGIATGGLIVTDRDLSKQAATPGRIDTSKKLSNYGLYSFIGAGAGVYGLGLMTHDAHKRETGLLSGEAFINATLVGEVMKTAFGRERPLEGDHAGHFRRGGGSFPSVHSLDSWAVASVFAHEYPNPFVKIAAYALASTVSVTRITAAQHFPSDVLVGSVFGYLIGRKVYNDHHDPELSGAQFGTFVREKHSDADHAGSAYVPLESWVYPVIDRLSALGLIHSNFDSERPFTRLECARIASEAADNIASDDVPADVSQMVESLQLEFARESDVWAGDDGNRSLQLESVYSRATAISGPVLRDSFHFAQTIYNDYGRPYARGFNDVTGFSARATSGPMVFYFRGEYQHSGNNPTYSPQTLAEIRSADSGPTIYGNPFPAENRLRVLDAYVGVNFGGNQLTLGQQSLWWGPGTGGPFMLSNNAEPLKMVRLSRTTPIKLPGFMSYLGPLRYEAFVGQMDGYHYLQVNGTLYGPHLGTQPFIQGQRFTFKPTENFEFGFSRTGVFGGTGNPLTSRYFITATFSVKNSAFHDPGDRRSGVDLTYRIPKLRNWLTFYADEFSDDEVSPLFVPRRSAMRSGIYMPKLPRLHRVDLRVEGVYTDPPSFGYRGFFYDNVEFKNGYTKNGDLLGSWIGREGRGISAVSRIWLSPFNSVELGYRGATADHEFLQGGHYTDFSIRSAFRLPSDLWLSTDVQAERWRFPALAAGPQRNVVSSLQLTYSPGKRTR